MRRSTLIAFSFSAMCCSAWAQTSAISSVTNVLGLPGLSPGGFVTVYGSFPSGRSTDFTVNFGTQSASIRAVAVDARANRAIWIAVQIPTEAAPGATSVTVTYLPGNVATPPFPVTISQFDPVISLDPFSAFDHMSGLGVTPTSPAAPGETITTFMSGLGATTPLVPTGTGVTSFTPTASTVSVTVGGAAASLVFAGRYPSNPPFVTLDDQVSFIVPAGAPTGPDDVVVSVGGVASNTQTLFVGTQALAAPPVIGTVVNAASFSNQTPLSPGSFATIFATGLGSQDVLSAFPNTQVNGVSVLFNGRPVPIFNVVASAGQMTVLVPSDVVITGGAGGVTVSVKNQNGPSKASVILTAAAGPAMFSVPDPSTASRHTAAVLLSNTSWYVMPASQATALGLPACTGMSVTARCGQPAKRGDFVQLYATGLGITTPGGDPAGVPLGMGQVAPASGSPIYATIAAPIVTVGGQPATIVFAGLAPGYAGLYQVNFQVPMNITPGDNVALVLAMPGSTTDTATIALQ